MSSFVNQNNTNTTKFKNINGFTKNENSLNNIIHADKSAYISLMECVKNNTILKDDKDSKPNITYPQGRLLLTTNEYIRDFFNRLQECSDLNIPLHFRELQCTDILNDIGSGIMYDFDLLQAEPDNKITDVDFKKFIEEMFKIISKYITLKREDLIYVGIIVKKTLVYKEDKKLYKNGFHVIIPNIKLARETKKFIFNKILEDVEFKNYFKEAFNNTLKDAFDEHSSSVPVYFLNNCKESSIEPYYLHRIITVECKSKSDIRVATTNNDDYKKLNLIQMFSLTFDVPTIKKKYYKLDEPYHSQIIRRVEQQFNFEKKKDESLITFNKYNCYAEENLDYYKKILLEILNVERAIDRNQWRNVIYATANINEAMRPAFKELARLFSMRCEDKYDETSFENLWDNAIANESNNKLTFSSIIYWAKEDNRDKFDKLLNKDIRTTIENDVFSRENRLLNGSLYQYHFAYYIFHIFKQKFVYDVDDSGKHGSWYEFVLENDEHVKGQVYKWRKEAKPDNLILYLSNRLPEIISDVIIKAEERLKNCTDKIIIEYIQSRCKNLKKSGQGLWKSDCKAGILKESEAFFRRRGFADKLDTCDNIMGVNNGVLELSSSPRLIEGYHDYPISLYSEVKYKPFNKNEKYSKRLIDVLLSLFPENELDSFHYLMYYLASSLDGKAKESMVLILTGNGCHSINTPIRMFDGTIKLVQDIQIGDKIMGDDGAERNVLELFRGKDQMVKIKPVGKKEFIVNINHILSTIRPRENNKIEDIKFTELLNMNDDELSNLYLYDYNKNIYEFTYELLDIDNYYGFELDNNHRYMTEDYIIHHNSNGKSTLAELIKTVLGKYASKVSMSVLTEQNRQSSSGANEQLMAFKKARLAFYSETNKSEKINCAIIKELTSQESISGRGIFEKQTNFRPMCNHLVTTNYEPCIRTTDNGIWRRIYKYEFKMTFTMTPDPENKFEKMADATIAKEFAFNDKIKEAFLGLLVEYYRDLHTNHNGQLSNIACPTIKKESMIYRNNEDILNRFICENVIYSPDSESSMNEIIENYELWINENIGKNSAPERVEIKSQIGNSILIKYMKRNKNSNHVFKNIRLIDRMLIEDQLAQNEVLLKEKLGLNSTGDKHLQGYDMTKYNPLNL